MTLHPEVARILVEDRIQELHRAADWLAWPRVLASATPPTRRDPSFAPEPASARLDCGSSALGC